MLDLSMQRFTKTVLAAMWLSSAAFATAVQAQDEQPSSMQETYDDWMVQCHTVAKEDIKTKSCEMSQELRQKDSNQRVLAIGIVPASGDLKTRATVIAPFGLLLANGLAVEVAEKELMRGTFKTCLPAGCIVEINLSDELIKTLAANEKASVVMTASDTGQPVRTNISLKGFLLAWNRLVALSKQ
jgi:invasion protein IalB